MMSAVAIGSLTSEAQRFPDEMKRDKMLVAVTMKITVTLKMMKTTLSKNLSNQERKPLLHG